MKNLYLLLLSFFMASVVLSEQAVLTVLVKGTGDILPEAQIVFIDGDYLTTDDKGQARLDDNQKNKKIKIMAMGFEPLSIDLSKHKNYKFYLYPQVVSGASLEVVADRIKQKASKIVLHKQELTKSAGSQGDPIKVLQSLPGVVAASDSRGQVYIRGSDLRDNVTWINYMPVWYLFHWGGINSVLHPDLVEDFNIFLSGAPVQYDDKLGGVIDVRLREPKKDRFHQKYDISTYASSFLLEGPLSQSGDKSFYLTYRRSYIDALMSPDKFSNMANSDNEEDEQNKFTLVPKFYDLSANYHQELENGKFDVFYISAGDKLELTTEASAKADPNLKGKVHYNVNYNVLSFLYQKMINQTYSFLAPLTYNRMSEQIEVGTNPFKNEPYYLYNKIESVQWYPRLKQTINKNTSYSYGLDLQYYKAPLKMDIVEPPENTDLGWTLTGANSYQINKTLYFNQMVSYIKQSLQHSDKFKTIAGIRYSTITGDDDTNIQGISPRIATEYDLTDKHKLTSSWGRYLQMPEGYQLLDGLGNPSLSFTEAEQRTIGLQSTYNPQWFSQIEIYHKPMKNLVAHFSTKNSPDNYKNEETGEAYGADLYLKHNKENGSYGWLSYSYLQSTRDSKIHGKTSFEGEQPHNLTLVYNHPINRQWSWGIKAKYHTGAPFTKVIGRVQKQAPDGTNYYAPIHNQYNSDRLPDYYKIDLRFDKTILYDTAKLNFYIDLQNITFKRNVVGYEYGNEYDKIDKPQEMTSMGFMPFFGVQIEF
ncbi:MAG: hypothetical protein DRQ51_07570 [Gammaproteobacteria bacterium]|nr:MAG: hypothetical protein DRQ51_07570 [Gammaproteobacteria bacterium]